MLVKEGVESALIEVSPYTQAHTHTLLCSSTFHTIYCRYTDAMTCSTWIVTSCSHHCDLMNTDHACTETHKHAIHAHKLLIPPPNNSNCYHRHDCVKFSTANIQYIHMEKRQHRCDVPVFGIINFKFVNTSYVVKDLFFILKKSKILFQ